MIVNEKAVGWNIVAGVLSGLFSKFAAYANIYQTKPDYNYLQ